MTPEEHAQDPTSPAADLVASGQERHPWEQDELLCALKPILTATPGKVAAVSFDFFDTLVHRLTAEPDDLFFEVGRRMQAQGLLSQPIGPQEFANVRKMADQRARQRAVSRGAHPEVQLRHIYEEMRNLVPDPAKGLDLELSVETELCFVNSAMADLVCWVKSRNLRAIVLSDTYFSRDQIWRLMDAIGLDYCLFDHVIVSSEHAAAKWEGTLYPLALKLLGIGADQMLHIGDNPRADFQRARAAGIAAHFYPRMSPVQEEVHLREGRAYCLPEPVSGSLNSLRRMSARQCARNGRPDGAFRDGAFLLGAPLARYADWCVDHLRQRGLRRVFALMREGALLGELVSRSAADSGLPIEVVPCFASRTSTALATLVELTPERLREVLTGGPLLTLRDAFEILDVREAAGRLPEEQLSARLDNQGALEAIIAAATKGSLRKLIEDRARARLERAAAYFRELAAGHDAIAFLDIGWSGSIQRNIVKILELSGMPVRSLGCYFATTERSARMALDGHPAVGFLEASWSKCSLILENAITATVGSTVDYELDEAGVSRPRLAAFEASESEIAVKASLRQGILHFQERWLAVRRKLGPEFLHGEPLKEIDRSLRPIVHRLIDFPTRSEAERFGALEHDENYGVLTRRRIIQPGVERALRREGIAGFLKSRRSFWPAGAMALETPAVIRSYALRWEAPVPAALSGQHARSDSLETGWTQAELQGLEQILATLRPSRVVNFGHGLPGDVHFLVARLGNDLAAHAGPRVLDVVPSATAPSLGEAPQHAIRIAGNCDAPQTLQAAADCLAPPEPTLVVFGRWIPAASANKAMTFLAPHLAVGSAFAFAHADSDPLALGDHTRSSPQALRAWLLQGGPAQDFGITPAVRTLAHLAESWTVICRVSAQYQPQARSPAAQADSPAELAPSAGTPSCLPGPSVNPAPMATG